MEREHGAGGRAFSDMAELKEYIQAHLHEDLSSKKLAELTGYSVFHFPKIFRRSNGECPREYVANRRIELAKKLLMRREKLSSVAQEVGYKYASNFCRFFREETRQTPREWVDGNGAGE